MHNLLIALALVLLGGATPTVNDTGKCWSYGVLKSFTVTSVNSGNRTFAVSWSNGGLSGVPFSHFHAWPTQDFIIGDDIIGVTAPTVSDKAMLYIAGKEVSVTVTSVNSGARTFDVVDDTNPLAVYTSIPFTKWIELPAAADFIIGCDIMP